MSVKIRLFKIDNDTQIGKETQNSSLEGGVEQSETEGVRSNTPPDLWSDSPQGEN